MKNFPKQYIKGNIYVATACNILLMMAIYMLSRFVFYWVNISFFPDITFSEMLTICLGGLKFDLSAVLYTNLLYLLLMIVPFPFRYNEKYQKTAKWIFIITNGIALIANCVDMIYFKFTTRRTTLSVFSEFEHEGNLGKIFLDGAIQYWYVVLFGLAILAMLYFLYYQPKFKTTGKKTVFYYIRNTIAFVVICVLVVGGLRGGLGTAVRPITLSNANQYVDKSIESAIVLNTPFCIYRTAGVTKYKNPNYFKTEDELESVCTPVIQPHPTGEFKNLNVVVFILESFSKEFVGELNKDLDGGNYKGYTPFLDSLIREGFTYEYTFATGRKSIDAMPSILSSIPAFYEPYILTPYAAANNISGIAGELNNKGYYTAFFHGAPNGSMGFQAFAKASGFKDYYGLDEYMDKANGFDGTWAIWDEEFFQFYAHKMSTFKQPFMTALFSATSHHPFKIPERYKTIFPEEGGHEIHKCIRYTDYSIRRFFETASKQPWFKNTLFVFTADHTNALTRKEYLTDAGHYKVPIVFYQPDSNLKGRIKGIAQQTDIMPTVLGYLNYDKPFVSFGHDLLDPNYNEHYAINFNNQVFQYFKGDYMFLFDGKQIISVYDFVNDIYLKNNLKDRYPELQADAEKHIKAIVQQYIERILSNNLCLVHDKN